MAEVEKPQRVSKRRARARAVYAAVMESIPPEILENVDVVMTGSKVFMKKKKR